MVVAASVRAWETGDSLFFLLASRGMLHIPPTTNSVQIQYCIWV